MLSQNYGGGTANIEFEALTSFSMELMNAQMTTPYTMMIPKMTELPSIVSLLKEQSTKQRLFIRTIHLCINEKMYIKF